MMVWLMRQRSLSLSLLQASSTLEVKNVALHEAAATTVATGAKQGRVHRVFRANFPAGISFLQADHNSIMQHVSQKQSPCCQYEVGDKVAHEKGEYKTHEHSRIAHHMTNDCNAPGKPHLLYPGARTQEPGTYHESQQCECEAAGVELEFVNLVPGGCETPSFIALVAEGHSEEDVREQVEAVASAVKAANGLKEMEVDYRGFDVERRLRGPDCACVG